MKKEKEKEKNKKGNCPVWAPHTSPPRNIL
jgi:hypothetical protein